MDGIIVCIYRDAFRTKCLKVTKNKQKKNSQQKPLTPVQQKFVIVEHTSLPHSHNKTQCDRVNTIPWLVIIISGNAVLGNYQLLPSVKGSNNFILKKHFYVYPKYL